MVAQTMKVYFYRSRNLNYFMHLHVYTHVIVKMFTKLLINNKNNRLFLLAMVVYNSKRP